MSLYPEYIYQRSYRGGVKAMILDWSGTLADAYVIAPAVVFVEVFRKHQVPISMAEARGPMGLRKDLHIQKLLEVPEIAARWQKIKGHAPGPADTEALFADFVPMQLACLQDYAALLPGVKDVCLRLQGRNIKLGTTTGFTRSMVDVLNANAIREGLNLDVTVAGDEVKHGARPAPHMVYRNLDLLGIDPIESVVKVDDTVSGVGEALNAGCWGVGVSRYSNYMDIDSLEHEKQLDANEIARRHRLSHDILVKSGAHYVIDSLVDIEPVLADIERRLANGEKP